MENIEEAKMIEYKFRFIGEQECRYERVNAYESENLYLAKVEFVDPLTNQRVARIIEKWYNPVENKDVVEYIDKLVKIQKATDRQEYKKKQKRRLLNEYKVNRSDMITSELCELIDLLQDEELK